MTLDLEVTMQTLAAWVKQFKENEVKYFLYSRSLNLSDKGFYRLRKELTEVKQEQNILTKKQWLSS